MSPGGAGDQSTSSAGAATGLRSAATPRSSRTSIGSVTPKARGSVVAPSDRTPFDRPAEASIFAEPRLLAPADGARSGAAPPSDDTVLSAAYDSKSDEGFDSSSSLVGRAAAAVPYAVPESALGRWLLGLAVLLLAIAALPRHAVPDPRLGYLLATRRIEVAALGGSVFLGVLVVAGLG